MQFLYKKELASLFDPELSEYIQLTQTYRSTQQITDFSKAVLINGAQIDAFDRVGEKPTMRVVADQAELVQATLTQLARNDAAKETTAIITKTLAQAEEAYTQLREAAQVTIIRTENQRLVPGTIIVPAYLAKGLEFDAVIMWNASEESYHGDNERQLVYTIASRAMHQLTIYGVGNITSLLDVDKSLYIEEK